MQVIAIAKQEIRVLFRERVFFLLLGIFILMTLMSSSIGFIATKTTTSIYNSSVSFLSQKGIQNIPPNPLSDLPSLTNFRNIIIYMFLIGSLLALIIGHRSFIRERKAGTMPLLLTRPTRMSTLFIGKILGIFMALLGIIGFTFIISVLSSFFLPFARLNGSDIARLSIFYLLSLFYILLFTLIGFIFSIRTKSESLALFIPVCIWVGVSFILPELISGQTPTALLNPVTIDQMTQTGTFFMAMQKFLGPFSIGWQYTSFSSQLLDNSLQNSSTGIAHIISSNGQSIITLGIVLIVAFAICLFTLNQYNPSSEDIHE